MSSPAPICHPIRIKTKTKCDALAQAFPRLHTFSRAFPQLRVFTSSFDWFIGNNYKPLLEKCKLSDMRNKYNLWWSFSLLLFLISNCVRGKETPDKSWMLAILLIRSLTTITGMESNSLKFTVSVTGMLMLKVMNLPLIPYWKLSFSRVLCWCNRCSLKIWGTTDFANHKFLAGQAVLLT